MSEDAIRILIADDHAVVRTRRRGPLCARRLGSAREEGSAPGDKARQHGFGNGMR